MPEFQSDEVLWRRMKPVTRTHVGDPWAEALRQVRAVPGCGWVPVPPDVRVRLERDVHFKRLLERKKRDLPDALRASAMFGHPMYYVYADLATRQGWDPGPRRGVGPNRVDVRPLPRPSG